MNKFTGIMIVVILGAAVLALTIHERRTQEASIAGLRKEIAALADTREAAPRFIPVPVFHPGSRTPDETPPAPRDEAPQANVPATANPAPAKTPEVEMAETHAGYERLFTNQRIDSAWTERAKRLVDERLPALLPEGSTVRSIECRADLCRLETAHADRATYWKFLKAAFLTPRKTFWNGSAYSVPLNDDPSGGAMVTYLAREGAALPALSNAD
jgi:hypothetical protein